MFWLEEYTAKDTYTEAPRVPSHKLLSEDLAPVSLSTGKFWTCELLYLLVTFMGSNIRV